MRSIMPVGKYYCDYCDKQFQDTASARKRHLEGSQHQRARALWYDSLHHHTSSSSTRGVCHRFIRTGSCQYGDGCKYIHPKPPLPAPNQPILGGNTVAGHIGFMWDNLPPSLRHAPDGGYPSAALIEWG